MSAIAPSSSATQTAQYAYNAGFRGPALAIWTAIGLAESGGNPSALNNDPNTKDYSVGIWQVNYFGDLYNSRTQQFGTPAQLQANPQAQANAAYAISNGGKNPGPWTTFGGTRYFSYLPQAIAAANQVSGNGSNITTNQVASLTSSLGGGTGTATNGATGSTSATGAAGTVPAEASNGATSDCATKGNVFSEGGLFGIGSFQFTYCNAKALAGGGLMLLGGGLALAGVVLIVAVGVKGRAVKTLSGAVGQVTPQAQRQRAATRDETRARSATAQQTAEHAAPRAEAETSRQQQRAVREAQGARREKAENRVREANARTAEEQSRRYRSGAKPPASRARPARPAAASRSATSGNAARTARARQMASERRASGARDDPF